MKNFYWVLIGISALLVVGILAMATSTCLGFPGKSSWELEVWVSEETKLENGTVVLEGEIGTSGHTTGTTIEGVEMTFSKSNLTESKVIGTVSGYVQQNFTVRLGFSPDTIRIETANIQTGDDTEFWIMGLKRGESSQYEQFVQEKRTC